MCVVWRGRAWCHVDCLCHLTPGRHSTRVSGLIKFARENQSPPSKYCMAATNVPLMMGDTPARRRETPWRTMIKPYANIDRRSGCSGDAGVRRHTRRAPLPTRRPPPHITSTDPELTLAPHGTPRTRTHTIPSSCGSLFPPSPTGAHHPPDLISAHQRADLRLASRAARSAALEASSALIRNQIFWVCVVRMEDDEFTVALHLTARLR